MRNFFFIFILLPCCCFSQKELREHKYIYDLPFEAGKTVLIMQGYNGKFSHVDKYALDFRLRKGKLVCAARGGNVLKVVEHNNIGGANIKYINNGNYVVMEMAPMVAIGIFNRMAHLLRLETIFKRETRLGSRVAQGFPQWPIYISWSIAMMRMAVNILYRPSLKRRKKEIVTLNHTAG
jgi:hypothetical protein